MIMEKAEPWSGRELMNKSTKAWLYDDKDNVKASEQNKAR